VLVWKKEERTLARETVVDLLSVERREVRYA
jgi:hypothetical protein